VSVYSTEDAAGHDAATVRDNFIAPMDTAVAAALGPSRALVDASRARAVAVNLANAFASIGSLFDGVLAVRGRLQVDEMTRPDVLRQQWRDFGGTVTERRSTIQTTIATGIDELAVALKAEALPISDDPAQALLAREEVQLALRATRDALPFQVLHTQAARGGDIAAAVASEWGRLTLQAAQGGEDTGFGQVLDAAIAATSTGPDEIRRRAAAALQATRTPVPGRTVAALPEAQAFAGAVLDIINETIRRGIVVA
jgi:hypothetical protein